MRTRFLVAVRKMVADLQTGRELRPGLRVKRVEGHENVYEMTNTSSSNTMVPNNIMTGGELAGSSGATANLNYYGPNLYYDSNFVLQYEPTGSGHYSFPFRSNTGPWSGGFGSNSTGGQLWTQCPC